MIAETQNNILSLYELNLLIQRAIDNTFSGKSFWVKAEIHKLNIYRSGHAYPDLLEKKDNDVICSMRGVIWKNDWLRINQKFIDTIGEPLKENINSLLYVTVRYHPRYGLNIEIKDIDPNYTLGELEKQKKQTIERLKKENIFESNKKLPSPLVPQKLAIISVETSKGYNDLITTFQKYKHLYKIHYDLYPSLLQSEAATIQIKNQLEKIRENAGLYDLVLIIRGGGGEAGLSCYNDYDLCKTIATFPLPIITGIGHSTNYTVAEMVAHQNGITPTDTAMMMIQKFEQFQQRVSEAQRNIIQQINTCLTEQHTLINQSTNKILLFIKEIFQQQYINLNKHEQWIKNIPDILLKKQAHDLLQMAHQMKHAVHHKLSKQDKMLQKTKQDLYHNIKHTLGENHQKLQINENQLLQKTSQRLQDQKIQLNNIEKHLQILHPNNALKRGYSILLDNNNKVIKNASSIKEQERVKIKLYLSEIEASLTHIKITKYGE